ncbi:hypothetical protein DOTSEDRAFT_34877 [Dothistroma septosporum NZE10]|uniref:Uncharacterized protein n=1 Tax=Dothistroma septosporum (strain NZE10 / CBS 128990) TaxID=675120 RepID=N1PNF1_DOTSN|nr:hypothetical protein DOTSEDRAFT_34877 [Dothistroma septosporum NZE10]
MTHLEVNEFLHLVGQDFVLARLIDPVETWLAAAVAISQLMGNLFENLCQDSHATVSYLFRIYHAQSMKLLGSGGHEPPRLIVAHLCPRQGHCSPATPDCDRRAPYMHLSGSSSSWGHIDVFSIAHIMLGSIRTHTPSVVNRLRPSFTMLWARRKFTLDITHNTFIAPITTWASSTPSSEMRLAFVSVSGTAMLPPQATEPLQDKATPRPSRPATVPTVVPSLDDIEGSRWNHTTTTPAMTAATPLVGGKPETSRSTSVSLKSTTATTTAIVCRRPREPTTREIPTIVGTPNRMFPPPTALHKESTNVTTTTAYKGMELDTAVVLVVTVVAALAVASAQVAIKTAPQHLTSRWMVVTLDTARTVRRLKVLSGSSMHLKTTVDTGSFGTGRALKLAMQRGLDLLVDCLPARLPAQTPIMIIGHGSNCIEKANEHTGTEIMPSYTSKSVTETSATREPPSIHIFDLPVELRLNIYDDIIANFDYMAADQPASGHYYLPFLNTCRTFHHEALRPWLKHLRCHRDEAQVGYEEAEQKTTDCILDRDNNIDWNGYLVLREDEKTARAGYWKLRDMLFADSSTAHHHAIEAPSTNEGIVREQQDNVPINELTYATDSRNSSDFCLIGAMDQDLGYKHQWWKSAGACERQEFPPVLQKARKLSHVSWNIIITDQAVRLEGPQNYLVYTFVAFLSGYAERVYYLQAYDLRMLACAFRLAKAHCRPDTGPVVSQALGPRHNA